VRTRSKTTLRAVRPNAGLRAAYRKRLLALIDEMAASYRYWVQARYREHPPLLAQDASPAKELERELAKLSKQWRRRFDAGAEELARFFVNNSARTGDVQLRAILKKAGFTVNLKLTPALRDTLRASVMENVALIKSIPREYSTEVEGLVMRSVVAGRDLSFITRELGRRYNITRKRAELIARDQNNKATGALTRARYLDLGIERAVWLHSGGGRVPRPTHVKNSGKSYDIQRGWYDPAVKRRIYPGELINCRCVAKAVVKGFS
jgi:uncharacterized protein with gpF-like domain